MSFMSGGFSRNGKRATQRSREDESKEEARRPEEGSWVVHHDAHGRPYWRHTVTGQFTYQLLQGGHVVSPDTVHTVPALGSSAQQPQQQQQQPGAVFQATPSWGHTVVPGSPMPYLIPDGDGEETTHAGVWEMFYDVNGQRYWGNSETGNITYEDPYV